MQTPSFPVNSLVDIVTWDSGERESFHTIECVTAQILENTPASFTWVTAAPKLDSLRRYKSKNNLDMSFVRYGETENWHVGRMLNYGANRGSAKYILFIDGDIVFDQTFIADLLRIGEKKYDSAIYVRRFDELSGNQNCPKSIGELMRICEHRPYFNFGGCLLISRRNFRELGGFEEHPIFSGPGAIHGDLAVRIVNLGIPVIWERSLRVFHPWHPGTYVKHNNALEVQKFVIAERTRRLLYKSDVSEVSEIVSIYTKNSEGRRETRKRLNVIDKLINLIR